MPRFYVTLYEVTAEIWKVDAKNQEEAIEKAHAGMGKKEDVEHSHTLLDETECEEDTEG